MLVLIRPVPEIKCEGVRPSSTKSRETRACPRPSRTKNQASGTLSVWYEVVQKDGLSSSVWNEESSRQNFIHPLRSHVNGEYVLLRLVRGIKQAGLHPSSTKLHKECFSMSVRYEESSMRDFVRPEQSRANVGMSSSIRYEDTIRQEFVRSV